MLTHHTAILLHSSPEPHGLIQSNDSLTQTVTQFNLQSPILPFHQPDRNHSFLLVYPSSAATCRQYQALPIDNLHEREDGEKIAGWLPITLIVAPFNRPSSI